MRAQFLKGVKGNGEGLQSGELGQKISAGFGPGSKECKFRESCKRVLLGWVLTTKRRGSLRRFCRAARSG